MTTSEKKIYLVYGSQTGNAESIAKEVSETLISDSIPTECISLNAAKGMKNLKDTCLLLTIICSTTGNGDSPENADAWWRSVKLRSAAKDMFSGIDYIVLGLGDTNYDKFCHMGKSIDKRLSELGGSRRLELTCVDEATGLEETVEAWKIKFFEVAKSIHETYQQAAVEQ